MLKPAVPSPTATSNRSERGQARNSLHDWLKLGRSRLGDVSVGLRTSCFQSATTFRIIVAIAAPCTTLIRRNWLKSASTRENTAELAMVPTRSIT